MNEMNDTQKERIKSLKVIGTILLVSYLIGNWIATQITASACQYNKLLGSNLTIGSFHIYTPNMYYVWSHDPMLSMAIPHILASSDKYIMFSLIAGALLSYLFTRSLKVNISHGSASWATKKDIDDAGLGAYNIETKKKKFLFWHWTKKIKHRKSTGVVVGINPYTQDLMLDDSNTHTLLIAPTRSGKGVNTIIPTGVIWKGSMLFFDVKGELWKATAKYRQKFLHQKVMKFEPMCIDGSTVRWNPFAEINFKTEDELSDVSTIVETMIRPDGEKNGGEAFWDNSAAALINAVILHLLYKNWQENKPLPCPTDVMSFLSSPDMDTDELFSSMKFYPHISPKEFLELEYEDENTHEKKHYINPLKEIYGEYIRNFAPFNAALQLDGDKKVKNIEELRLAMLDKNISFAAPDSDDEENESPFWQCLVHPKVAEGAANMLNGAEQTRASIMQTAQTALAMYQNPVVQKNTAVSDFCIKDLLDPKQEVSLYLVIQEKDLDVLRPISRLFINTLLSKLIRDLKFEKDINIKSLKKQRLLLMLDEFPQLKKLNSVEMALAVCAGYGIKMCIVAQDVNQLNAQYTKDNSIASNCRVNIYFTPNLDSAGNATAKAISTALGKKTISTVSHSDGGGGFLKGSNSASYTARDLMTPDEVGKMSAKKEIVFVSGLKPILGDKLFYFRRSFFNERILHPPLYSDTATVIRNYKELFAVNKADRQEIMKRKAIIAKAKLEAESA